VKSFRICHFGESHFQISLSDQNISTESEENGSPFLLFRVLEKEREIFLQNLYVPPEMRGQGISRELVDHLMQFARESGIRSIVGKIIGTDPDNPVNTETLEEIYRKLQFQVDDEGYPSLIRAFPDNSVKGFSF